MLSERGGRAENCQQMVSALLQRIEPMIHLDLEARQGRDEPRLLRADQQTVARHAQSGRIVAEHHAGHGQVKRADALEGDDGDGMQGGARSRRGDGQPLLEQLEQRLCGRGERVSFAHEDLDDAFDAWLDQWY